MQSNKEVNYIFRKNGIIDLNYLPVDNNNNINFYLKSITVTEGIDSAHKHKVRLNKHSNNINANNTIVTLDKVTVAKNAVFKLLPGTKLVLGDREN